MSCAAGGPLWSPFSVPLPKAPLFPCYRELIPCRRELIPCCGRIDSLFRRTGNFISRVSQTTEFADVFGTVFRSNQRILEEFADNSLQAGQFATLIASARFALLAMTRPPVDPPSRHP
jgi:hypothetical protein